ncbi:MAG: SurA N-terminal domain-containing protein [Alphaproteobacteria bacterium]|nr:SurA N-terminal domain-containing protein [Alphaproteobacteria bacterium]
MKKTILLLATFLLMISSAQSEDINLQQLDTDSRASQPNSNSLMFRRNADQYRQLSEEEKADIAEQREIARRRAEEYQRQQMEEYRRRQAEAEAQRRQMEEERRRAEALKPITLYGNKLKIYALVNGQVITSNDMQSRINAFILTTGIPYNNKTKSMITNKVLQGAIDEKLKLQEAKKNKIVISQKELAAAVRNFEKSNGMKAGQLDQILAQAKVSPKVWITQIEADLAWKKLISMKGYNKISVGEYEIKRAYDDIKKDMKTKKYMLSEIVINKKDAKDIRQLSEVLRQDPRFELYAMQFSQSPSAANGGRLGWVLQGKLPSVLEKAVVKLKEGGVSDPIAYGNDYYIFKMDRIFNPETDAKSLPTRKEVVNFLENKKLEEMATKYMKDLRSRALIEKKI